MVDLTLRYHREGRLDIQILGQGSYLPCSQEELTLPTLVSWVLLILA